MEIDSAEFTNEERDEICAWIEAAGYDKRKVCARFQVESALPGSVKLTFAHYRYDEDGRIQIGPDRALRDEFVIYASDRLSWLQHFFQRTGRHHELAGS